MRDWYEDLRSASHTLQFRLRELSEPDLQLHCLVHQQDVLRAIALWLPAADF